MRLTVEMRRPNQFLIASLLLLSVCMLAHAQTAGDPMKEAQRLTRVAQTAEQQNRPDDAIKAYETIAIIAKISPAIASGASLHAGNIYMGTGRFEKAANSFRAAIAMNPSSAEAQNNLGEALGELKQYQSALRVFQQ